MSGTNRWRVKYGPFTLTAKTSSKMSSEVSSTLAADPSAHKHRVDAT
jgi:hypothetical protein